MTSFPYSTFEMGAVALDAPVSSPRLPVVLLSHGTGGTAESLGWLARSLAAEGYVVLGVNHHGNTAAEPYRAEGFLCWWDRAADLSCLLTSLSDGAFADALDLDQVYAVGFSLGGYSVLSLAGARTSLEAFDKWREIAGIATEGPAEFPDAGSQIPKLLETSEVFRASWARYGDDYSDDRVKRIVAIAPGPPIRAFPDDSVAAIGVPLTILSGGADTEAPNEECADWLAARNPALLHRSLGEHVGHYTFLDWPSDRSLVGREAIFTDHPGVDRARVHAEAASIVQAAFR